MLQVQIVHYLHEYIEYTHAGQPICNISSTQCCESKHNVQFLDLDWTQIQVLKFVTNWTRIRVFLHAVQYSYIIDFEEIWTIWPMKKGLNKDGDLWSVPPPLFFNSMDPDPCSEYGSTKLSNTDSIWIRIHNTGSTRADDLQINYCIYCTMYIYILCFKSVIVVTFLKKTEICFTGIFQFWSLPFIRRGVTSYI